MSSPARIRRRLEGRGSRAIGLTLFFLGCFASTVKAKQPNEESATVSGSVFVRDSDGNPSQVAGAKVKLTGPATLEGETDQNGEYAIQTVPYGVYTLEVSSTGLKTIQSVRVEGKEFHLDVELKPGEVSSSVTVTADATEAKGSASSETISDETLRDAPNVNERFESSLPLVPGVVRGPDGHVNLKGTRNTQSGALVNSTNVTDPVTGGPAINLPIDVVSSVKVISNPYDPGYGRFTGAVSSVETKTSDYEKYHFSFQNFIPRVRDRDGTVRGIGAATPRATFTGPLVKDKVTITQSFEYRYVQTPVNSLPPLQRDTKLESFDSYTQLDYTVSSRQTANVSIASYPQRLNYLGLNTFTTQQSTPDFHQRGYQINAQDSFLIGGSGLLTSQFSYKKFDADVTAQSNDPYRILLETTEGGFFNRQARRTSRVSWQENYHFSPWKFAGTHEFTVGLSYEHSNYDGRETFLPVELDGVANARVEQISFSAPTSFGVSQNETAWFAGDQWAVTPRLTLDLGLRFDRDGITGSTHPAPRAGFFLMLTGDGKTLLKGGAGLFYDRVPLLAATFPDLPDRTVSILGQNDQPISSVFYQNKIDGGLRNPRSTSWSLELDRQIVSNLSLRVAYEQRNTSNDFIVSPLTDGATGRLSLSNRGSDSYREIQVSGRYRVGDLLLNASYVRSKAYGDLNDLNQFFGIWRSR
jgi:CarboxypepD_reg-like domain/TonB dependent receptor